MFLKENSRGLYSSALKWTVTDWPFYIWRMINAVFYVLIAWGMSNQPTRPEVFGFAIMSFMFLVWSSVLLSENVIFMIKDKRDCYTALTGLGFINFLFSGLFVKSAALPNWLGPWAPSLSMIRWNMQGNYISVYDGAFPVTPQGFSPYTLFLSLFGWGGKTKYYCFYMLLINVIIYKIVSFLTSGISAALNKGGRRGPDTD